MFDAERNRKGVGILKNDKMALLPIPEDYHVVQTDVRKRNKVQVTVDRYQNDDEVTPNNKHPILETDRKRQLDPVLMPAPSKMAGNCRQLIKCVRQAVTLFNQLDPNYADGLSYMRTSSKNAIMKITDAGPSAPVYRIKFAYPHGSYNWVTIGPDNRLLKLSASRFGITEKSTGNPKCGTTGSGFLARQGKDPHN